MSPLVWQTVLGDGHSVREGTAPGVGCYDSVVGEPTSAYLDSAGGVVDLAGGVTVGVTALTVTGVASQSILLEASPLEWHPQPLLGWRPGPMLGWCPWPTLLGCHRQSGIPGRCWADAGVASLADLAGGVTIGVASPAVAGVASLADAGVVSLADAGVTSLAVAGVASLAVAGVASLDDFC